METRRLKALGADNLLNHAQDLSTKEIGVFTPTGTTGLLIYQAKFKMDLIKGDLLDLGCGWGIIGLEIKLFYESIKLHLSDLSQNAVELAKKNCEKLGISAEIKCGSLFDPWGDKKFDYIFSDVSGISQDVPMLNDWFEGIPSQTGRNGTDLALKVLTESKYRLKPGGKLVFPLISLSNINLIEIFLKSNFTKYSISEPYTWEWPIKTENEKKIMLSLRDQGAVSFEISEGKYILKTYIAEVTNE